MIDDPYIIKSVDDWNVIDGKKYYFNSHFKVFNHLNFTGMTVKKLDLTQTFSNGVNNISRNIGFAGIIDGNNKTFSRVNISGNVGNESMIPFIFGGEIKNLNFSGGKIESYQYGSYIASHSSGLILKNIHFYNPQLDGRSAYFGLFCSFCSNLLIEESSIYNAVITKIVDDGSGNAGIAGGILTQTKANKVKVEGSLINFSKYVGGFSAQTYGKCEYHQIEVNVNIKMSDNHSGERVGGMFGITSGRVEIHNSVAYGKIENNKDAANINTDDIIGGLIGGSVRTAIYDSFVDVELDLPVGTTCGMMVGNHSSQYLSILRSFSFANAECQSSDVNFVGSTWHSFSGGEMFYVQDDAGTCNTDNTKCTTLTKADMLDIITDSTKIFSDNAVHGVSLGWDSNIWRIVDGNTPKLKAFD